MNKTTSYIIGIAIGVFTLYHSVYFQPLDEKLASSTEKAFDATVFVEDLWENSLLKAYDSSVAYSQLMQELANDPEKAFELYSNALGVGNIAYFRVKGSGSIDEINENNVLLRVQDYLLEIETEFIFGNAVRDASGLIKLNDFDKTSDVNAISESINAKIRKEVIPGFKEKLIPAQTITFKGAIELNKAHLDLRLPELIPVFLEIDP